MAAALIMVAAFSTAKEHGPLNDEAALAARCVFDSGQGYGDTPAIRRMGAWAERILLYNHSDAPLTLRSAAVKATFAGNWANPAGDSHDVSLATAIVALPRSDMTFSSASPLMPRSRWSPVANFVVQPSSYYDEHDNGRVPVLYAKLRPAPGPPPKIDAGITITYTADGTTYVAPFPTQTAFGSSRVEYVDDSCAPPRREVSP